MGARTLEGWWRNKGLDPSCFASYSWPQQRLFPWIAAVDFSNQVFSPHILRTSHNMPPQRPINTGGLASPPQMYELQLCRVPPSSAWGTSTNSSEVSSSGSFPQVSFGSGYLPFHSLKQLWPKFPLLPHCQVSRYYSDLIILFCYI